ATQPRLPQTFRDAGLPSAEEMNTVPKLFPAYGLDHQVRTKHSLHCAKTLNMTHPYGWHTIRCDQKCFRKDRLHAGVSLSLHNSVHAGQANKPLATASNSRSKKRDGAPHVHGMNPDP